MRRPATCKSEIDRIQGPRADSNGGGGDQCGRVEGGVSQKRERQDCAEYWYGRGPGADGGGIGETGTLGRAIGIRQGHFSPRSSRHATARGGTNRGQDCQNHPRAGMLIFRIAKGLFHRKNLKPMTFRFEFHVVDAQRHRSGGEPPSGVFSLGLANGLAKFGSPHHDPGPRLRGDSAKHRRPQRDPDHQAADHPGARESEPTENEGDRRGGGGDEDERTEKRHVYSSSDRNGGRRFLQNEDRLDVEYGPWSNAMSIKFLPAHFRFLASVLSFLVVSSTFGRTAIADRLAEALGLVPSNAVAWAVIPSMSGLNADLADMLDRANRPELAVAGRPIDVLVSQFGIAAGFDERGSLVAWTTTAEAMTEGEGVIAIPVEDSERFIKANFDPDPKQEPMAYRSKAGKKVFLKSVDTHVLITARRDFLDDWKPDTGTSAALKARFGAGVAKEMRTTDLLMWIDGGVLAKTREAAIAAVESSELEVGMAGLGGNELIQRLGDDVEDFAISVDVDALAIGLRSWTRFSSGGAWSNLAKSATSGLDRPLLDRLPRQAFYMAMGVDFAGFGGYQGMLDVLGVLDIDTAMLPEWMAVIGPSMRGMEFAMYPSKLGVAMGGALNDASLLMDTTDPDALRSAIGTSIKEMQGVTGAIERKTVWEADVTQRKGGTADEFAMTGEIAPASQRTDEATVGDASLQLTVEKMLLGPRGLKGFGQTINDGYVMTFSRRPDVLQRSIEAGTTGGGLAVDPVLASMQSWLPADPDFEMFIDVGQLGKLARQIAALFPGAAGMIPELPLTMPPIGVGVAFGLVEEKASLEWSLVVPSEVVGAAVGVVFEEMIEAPGAKGEP